ncbi:ATP-binding cassette transporter abc4 [Leucoagaricus sp. SymC.cos]|nr:ATP-binding cassette transporter abc4 [Leucoagaricus sp. SymC.cos]
MAGFAELANTYWCPSKSEITSDVYAFLLVSFAIASKNRNSWRPILLLHYDFVVFIIFAVYAYQDIWPLAKYSLEPFDVLDTPLLVKLVLLFFSGVILPLTTPYLRTFSEDETNVLPEGLSLWSSLTYSYLDHLMYLSKPDTIINDTPPLEENDREAPYLLVSTIRIPCVTIKALHIHELTANDPTGPEFVQLSFLQLSHTALFLLGPIGINGLLKYLEGRGVDSEYRPWVWIFLLFFGPSARTIMLQLYTSVSNVVMVQFEATLIRIVYEYTLRMRCHSDSGGEEKHASSSQVGKINNLATSDVNNIASGVGLLLIALYSPVMVIQCMWFLFGILEWSAILACIVMVLMLPLPARLSKALRDLQKARSRKTDARVQMIVEIMSMARTIKLLGWGPRAKQQLDEVRQEELDLAKRYKFTELHTANFNFLIPLVTMIVAYSTYTMLFHKELTTSRVFASMAIFENLRLHIRMVMTTIPTLIQGKVSFDRFDEFIRHVELVNNEERTINSENSAPIGFRNCRFSWSPTNPSAFSLKLAGEVFFEPGLTLVVGPTGCGKTSLLMALLGEMYLVSTTASSQIESPHKYCIAYAAQDSWIQSGTVKQNILFGSRYDEERYQQVISQCGLRQDLALWPNGDLTRIGERGLTLSGGQRARLTLARAVYSTAQVLLLDDTFAALDSQTSKWISHQCFHGCLMRNRTVILVTHHVDLLKPMARAIVTIDPEGNCLVEPNITESALLNEAAGPISEFMTPVSDILPMPNLDEVDEIGIEHSKGDAYGLYLSNMSSHPILLWVAVVFFFAGNDASLIVQAYWLGHWASRYEIYPPSQISSPLYDCLFYGPIQHKFPSVPLRSIEGVEKNPFCFVRISSRIILEVVGHNTDSSSCVDDSLSFDLRRVLELNISLVGRVLAIGIFSPFYIIPAVVITLLGLLNGQVYMRAQLPVRRMMSNLKSPVLAHLSETMDGLVSIRAYRAQEQYTQKFMERVDAYSRLAMTYWAMNRWVSIRSDILGALFTAGLSTYMVYGGQASACNTGFSLTMSFTLSGLILTWVRMVNKLELDSNSLERIRDYTILEQERTASEISPPAYWPSSGDLRAVNLSAKYSKESDDVLKNINFEVKGGERIGIVGRTGAGKCLVTQGEVYLDGIPTSKLGVATLRSKFTVIPQTPDLFNGSLRDNLDPFHDFDDADLHSALQSVGLQLLQKDQEPQSLLDTQVIGRGENLSVGQRQIIALARALLQRNQVLMLDEATSAIDYETDAAIQKFLRTELKNVTILTVAHRLRTVMDFNRIMVLSDGRIVEFDRPKTLLEIEGGYLKGMVDNSADKDELYILAGA